MALHITGDTAADELLTDNSLALLVGMLLASRCADHVVNESRREARNSSRNEQVV